MSTQRRLIVVSFHYPPDGFVGGLRWAGLTRHLARLGWRCDVVTAAEGSGIDEPGVTVHRVARRQTLNDAYRRVRQRASGDAPPPAAVAAAAPVLSAPPGWLHRLIDRARLEAGQALAAPDEARGWVWRAAQRAGQLIDDLRPDALVTSGPPHSAHVAGWFATRGTGVRWIADFRDPWAYLESEAWADMPHVRSYLARGLRRSLERLVVRSADRMICNTWEMGLHFGQRYPGLRPLWIPNGVDLAQLPPRPAERFPGMSVAYAGTLYGGRDLTPVVEALTQYLDGRGHDGSALRLAGHADAAGVARLQAAAGSHGTERVQYLGLLPRAQALDFVGRSQLALVLAQQQEMQVPAKLYELVGMGIPTLVLGPPDGASASEARRLGAYAVAAEDVAGIVRVLTAVAKRPPVDARPPLIDYGALAPLMAQALLGQTITGLDRADGYGQ